MKRAPTTLVLCLVASMVAPLLTGCATPAVQVLPAPADPAEFALWDCTRLHDETDRVQQRAADLAYAVDERVGNNMLMLGLGVTVFWPALLALRADGPDAADLARLKGRYEALRTATTQLRCPPPQPELAADRARALPVAVGDTLVYEDRAAARQPATPWVLQVQALRRLDLGFTLGGARPGVVRQDRAGNVLEAPTGELAWPRLLRAEMALGQVTAGEIVRVGDAHGRARLRGQVVAVGPQNLAGRRFDAAVVELFGEVLQGDVSTRASGVIVVDRASGLLLRLDLSSADPDYALQRRLVRVDAAAP